ncbi:protein kinase [Nannochloropsis oceanica]
MLRMIHTDEEKGETRKSGGLGRDDVEDEEEEGRGEEEYEEGAGKEELQSLVMRLLLHSAEAGAPLEPELEQDLRGLVGSHLFDEIFESSGGVEEGGGGRAQDPGCNDGGNGVVQHDLALCRARNRRSISDGSGGSIGGSGDMPRKLVAALAGLQLTPSLNVGMEGSGSDGSSGGGANGGTRAGGSHRERERRKSMEDKEEDEICLLPTPASAPSLSTSCPSSPSSSSHITTATTINRPKIPGPKAAATAVLEDEWISDADPGYVTLRITEQAFFDLEERALEAAHVALTARRKKMLAVQGQVGKEEVSGGWGREGGMEGGRQSMLEDDLAEAEALLMSQGPAPRWPLSSDMLEEGGEGGGEMSDSSSSGKSSSTGRNVVGLSSDGGGGGRQGGATGGGAAVAATRVTDSFVLPQTEEGGKEGGEEGGSRHGIGEALRAQARKGRCTPFEGGGKRGRGGGKDEQGREGGRRGGALESNKIKRKEKKKKKRRHRNCEEGEEDEEEEGSCEGDEGDEEEDEDDDMLLLEEEREEEDGKGREGREEEGEGEEKPETVATMELKVVYVPGKTGFEEEKDYVPRMGGWVGGRYKIVDVLGTAVFSTAVECVDSQATRRREEGRGGAGEQEQEPVNVCLKIIKNNKDFFDQGLDEIRLLRLLQDAGDPDEHHFLRMHDFFYYKEHLVIVSELLKDNLYEFQRWTRHAQQPSYFTLPRLRAIARQVLEALAFVHSQGLLHCDVKPENIVIKSYSRVQVKLIDFGSSCFSTDPPTSYLQSRSYRAPEVILGTNYNSKIDVWSVGCVLSELFSGYVLFQNESIQGMLARMQSVLGGFPEELLLFGTETTRYFTSGFVVYKREGKEGDEEEGEEEEEAEEMGGREEGGEGEEEEEGGKVSLLYPKKSCLAARIRTNDVLFLDFVGALLMLHPTHRPTAEEALKHPWLERKDEEEESGREGWNEGGM